MSITGVLNTALTGLFTAQASLRTTANNIANVNTEDYARQIVRLENIVVGGESAGVRISDIDRIVDRFLQSAGLDARSRAAAAETEDQFNQRFQGLLGRPDSQGTITARMGRLFAVIANLTINPSDQILRQASLASLQDLGDEISRVSNAIQDLRNSANQQIQEQVASVNEVLKRISALNPLIVRQQAIGGETAGLENRRDQALNNLAELLDIRITRNADGTIGVATKSGVALVDHGFRELEYNPPAVVTSETQFDSIQIWRIDSLSGDRKGVSRDFDHEISGGTLRGLLDLRDTELREMSMSLGEFSATLIDQINAVHNSFSAVPPPNQLVGKQTPFPIGQSMLMSGIATFAIVDSASQLVQNVTINFGTTLSISNLVTNVNAGLGGAGVLSFVNGVMTLTATDPTHGVVIADDPANPSSRGGQGFSHFFGMNDLLGAAVEVNYDTGLKVNNTHNIVPGGTTTFELRDQNGRFLTQYTLDPAAAGGTFGDLLNDLSAGGALGNFLTFTMDPLGAIVVTPTAGNQGVRFSVISDTTDVAGTGVSFTRAFGIGDQYRVNPSKEVQIVSRIAQSPGQFALASFDFTVGIGGLALSLGDQTGALALQALETAVVKFDAAGELADMSVSLGQYAAAFYSNAGLKAARAEARAEDQISLLTEINKRIADVSGVNLDEELANMIILQTSFNAAARLITTSQEMFDALLAAV